MKIVEVEVKKNDICYEDYLLGEVMLFNLFGVCDN